MNFPDKLKEAIENMYLSEKHANEKERLKNGLLIAYLENCIENYVDIQEATDKVNNMKP